jgi:antirestriction protein ArdC
MTDKKNTTRKGDEAPRDYYQEVTSRIVAALEQGVKPWSRPWDASKSAGPMAPYNPTTGQPYKGINTVILGMDARAFETGDPRWCSFNQGKAKGWSVRKGEKSTTIFFFKPIKIEDETAKDGERTVPVMRAYPVFHASQFDGIPERTAPTVTEAPWLKPEAAEIILRNSGATLRTGGDKAFYSPNTDHIQLPPHEAFKGPEAWAATALHELGHWTGAPHRLNRDLTGRFGSSAYAMEELRAELSSVFVGSILGIPSDIPNHASYLGHWARKLKEDKREIFRAASDAQKIADYELAYHPEYGAKMKADATARVEIEQERATAPVPAPAAVQRRPASRAPSFRRAGP